jgi:O-succinylbenzoic acid--CoA ligase
MGSTLIHFNIKEKNQLLLNPKLSANEKNNLIELKLELEKVLGTCGYFIIASSGSSQMLNQSVKLIALSTQSILNSALRFNSFFKALPTDKWGLVLPVFHVAGLSTYARASLTGAQVCVTDWNVELIYEWLFVNQISHISLVPAQVFDLVNLKLTSPVSIKKIFVGAGSLNLEIKKSFKDLGWPVVETYGMTETCSMIAVKNENDYFTVMPDVHISELDNKLKILCNSLLTAWVQKTDNVMQTQVYLNDQWLLTEDRIELIDVNQFKYLGRSQDYTKILGEGVSLTEIRSIFDSYVIELKLNVQNFVVTNVDDLRTTNKLILAVENSVDKPDAEKLVKMYNESCRPFEKILHCIYIRQIPRTSLGKLKNEELKSKLLIELNRGLNDQQ